MGVLAEALYALAGVEVSGVTSYQLETTPGALTRVQLPALVIVPELGGDAPGLEPNTIHAGDGQLSVQVAHALLLAPVAGGMGARSAFPALANAVDAYAAALAADPTLGGTLPVPLRCRVRIGVVRYGGIEYHAALFTHLWTLFLT